MEIKEILIESLSKTLGSGRRYILGIAGPPAAGKSTLAIKIATYINSMAGNEIAVSLPMDGFHEYNSVLIERNQLHEKGAPWTFRVSEFLKLLAALRFEPESTIYAPEYDRSLHDPTEGGISITPFHKVVIIEGNYLANPQPPWASARKYFDKICFLDSTDTVIYRRLLDRHLASGKNYEDAIRKIESVDLENAKLIRSHKQYADCVVDLQDDFLFEKSKVEPSDLLGLGACTVDLLEVIDHFPKGRETQLVQQLILEGGGPVATAVYTFAKLGGRSGIVDRFDLADWRAKAILDEFQKLGVSLAYARFDGKGKASLSNILVEKRSGDRAICFYPGSVEDITEDEIDQIPLNGVKVVHLNGRHPAAAFRLARRAKSLGITVSFDGGAQRYSEVTHKLAALSDICIVAEDFSKHIGGTNVQESAKAIQAMGPKIVGITQGRLGSWFMLDDGCSFHQPAFITDKTVDTTGCGDSFHGAFIYAFCQGSDIQHCAKFASAVASINSQCLGGRGGLPTKDQVEKFLVDHENSRSSI